MIKFLIEKEFKQLFRNSFLPKLIFIFPCMIMILMPWAANLEIKNINLNIVDNDHSVLSRRLVDKIGASTYFRLTALPDTYDEALLAIEAGSADVVLEIPRDFEKDWVKGEAPRLLVAANAVNGTKGSLYFTAFCRRDISSLSTAWRCFFYRWCRGSGWSYPIIRPRCSRPCLSCGSSCLSLF